MILTGCKVDQEEKESSFERERERRGEKLTGGIVVNRNQVSDNTEKKKSKSIATPADISHKIRALSFLKGFLRP